MAPADDAFLLGDALAVAPALRPASSERTVQLPPGHWYRWRPVPPMGAPAPVGGAHATDATTLLESDGARALALDTPPGQPVVLVRAGSIVPLDDGTGPVDEGHRPRLLALHCFPDPDPAGAAAGTCYDDDGDGDGPWGLDHFVLQDDQLEWHRAGEHPAPDR
ncbi:MAG: hypothetical protein ACRDWN_08065, partial [Acidimicrobiales bacterium]